MDFTISEKMQTILGMINEFVDKELIPLEKDFLADKLDKVLPVLEKKRAMVKQMELWAPLHPVEYGGMGLSLAESALIFEALGRTPLGLYAFGCKAPDAGNIEILHKYATPEQTKQWLHPLVAGLPVGRFFKLFRLFNQSQFGLVVFLLLLTELIDILRLHVVETVRSCFEAMP